MAEAEIKEVLKVDKDKLFQTITRYEDYPKFVEGVQTVEVKRGEGGNATVKYSLSMMGKQFSYTLNHREDLAQGIVEWSLVESDFFKKNNGGWKIESKGPSQTQVHYHVDVEFSVPIPGFILKGLIKGNLPTMLKSFEKRALA